MKLLMGRRWMWQAGLVPLFLGFGLCVGVVQAADSPAGSPGEGVVKDLLRQVLEPVPDGGASALSLVEVSYPPGGSSEAHRHPGPVVVYVLEGSLEFQAGDGPLQLLQAGDVFFEPAGVVHRISRNASQTSPARFLAWMLIDAEETELVQPAD